MTQKEKAVECLQELDVFCTDLFVEKNKVAVFHSYLGEALSTYPGLREKIAEVEKRSGCLVYAVTHEYFSFGECFSFLVVSKYEEDWQYSLRRFANDCYRVFAWCWNKTHEECSEFGFVLIHKLRGGIARLG